MGAGFCSQYRKIHISRFVISRFECIVKINKHITDNYESNQNALTSNCLGSSDIITHDDMLSQTTPKNILLF